MWTLSFIKMNNKWVSTVWSARKWIILFHCYLNYIKSQTTKTINFKTQVDSKVDTH